MIIEKAQDFSDACMSGLTLVGVTEDKRPEWMGTDKNWNAYQWLRDGAYDSEEDRYELINQYLS